MEKVNERNEKKSFRPQCKIAVKSKIVEDPSITGDIWKLLH